MSVGVSVGISTMRKEEKRMVRNECDVRKCMMLAIVLIVQAACRMHMIMNVCDIQRQLDKAFHVQAARIQPAVRKKDARVWTDHGRQLEHDCLHREIPAGLFCIPPVRRRLPGKVFNRR